MKLPLSRRSLCCYRLYRVLCFLDDAVYMPDEEEREEYVLNDHGLVFQGNKLRPRGKDWNFGQVGLSVQKDSKS